MVFTKEVIVAIGDGERMEIALPRWSFNTADVASEANVKNSQLAITAAASARDFPARD